MVKTPVSLTLEDTPKVLEVAEPGTFKSRKTS